MRNQLSLYLITCGLLLAAPLLQAESAIVTLAKAQQVLNQANSIIEKYQKYTTELEAPDPIEGNKGKYILPYHASGETTEWADKALTAQAGAAAGEQAANVATKTIATKVPFGSAFGGLMKNKGKEMAAVTAIGGWDYIRETSSLSFKKLDDYAVWLHVNHSGSIEYEKTLAAAMAIYPDLEKDYDNAIKDAYKDAEKLWKKK